MRYGQTFYSDGMESGLIGRTYSDELPQRITMAIANRPINY